LGEFLHSVRFNHDDPRLRDLYEERDQSMGVGEAGGFMVPKQLREGLLSLTPQQAIFRPRATIIPAGSPPDAEISMVALNQGAQKNMYGGVSFAWLAEGGTKPATDLALKEITLRPHEIAGHTVITDKLLRNWPAAASTIEAQFRLAMIAAEENAFYNGTGVGQPLGLLKSPARIEIARATANQVAWADIYKMYARLRMNYSPVWICSQTIIPYLVTIADAGNNNLWMPSAAPGLPPTLMGIPVLFNERSVALGTAGDLILADLSQYLIKDGSGPFVAMSEHVYFTSNKSVIKIFWNVDGQPWMSEPIPLEGSTSNTVSPFIVLK
jgi:HK97 family phage major capsid protein